MQYKGNFRIEITTKIGICLAYSLKLYDNSKEMTTTEVHNVTVTAGMANIISINTLNRC